MVYVAYALATLAILVMALDVYLALKLKGAIVGGEVGRKWSLMTTLIVVFFVGYLFSPLVLYLEMPIEVLSMLVFAVFLFGAVFVWVVIGIIRESLEFLELLKK